MPPTDETIATKCSECGADHELMRPDDPEVEINWVCPTCGTPNHIEGHPGEPGEGAINPAATAVTDDEIVEAYERRGLGATGGTS